MLGDRFEPQPPPEGIGFVAYCFFCFAGICYFVQGVAVFGAGLSSPKTALTQSSYSILAFAIVMVQFYTIGFSVEASETAGPWSKFCGDLRHAFMRNLDLNDYSVLGQLLLLYAFSVVPAGLLASSACQRGRFVPLMVFLFVWLTVVYCPVARWCWHPAGWSYQLGALDFAGGTVIHITSGCAALVYSLCLGPRLSYMNNINDRPYSLGMVVRGTVLMWVGWIGFTGGSQYADPAQALISIFNTWLSASMGGLSWMFLDHWVAAYEDDGDNRGSDSKYSIVSFCSGVVSGLVTVTPAAGYVPLWSAALIGIIGGVCCNVSTKMKFYLGVDDSLDVFAVHGVGGLLGTVLTGVFALEEFRRPWQLARQLLSGVTVAAYTLGCTLMILVVIDSIPTLEIRVSPAFERLGLDLSQHGESSEIGVSDTGRSRYVRQSLATQDYSRLRQTNVNSPMFPGSFDQPLLQRLPVSYGTYTRQNLTTNEQMNMDPSA